VPITPAKSGFLLLDASLNPLESNNEAIHILSYPSNPDRIKQLQTFLSDRVRTTLIDHSALQAACLVNQFRSGRRRYFCRNFGIDLNVRHSGQPVVAVLLQRNATAEFAVEEICRQFDLTRRERETVGLLFQGLTTKEIANRLCVSTNTIKAFIRLVMVKMNVSTRSGIVGRIAASARFLPPHASA
jgi:DNA-binding CsgD family transcriptional regulator